jgi:hypothetical protein
MKYVHFPSLLSDTLNNSLVMMFNINTHTLFKANRNRDVTQHRESSRLYVALNIQDPEKYLK